VTLLPIFEWLNNTTLANTIHEVLWLFPTLLTVHILGTVLLAGTIAILDLRLLGNGMRRQAVSELAEQLLPWTWAGFALVALSGLFLLAAEAVKAYGSTTFWVKMGLLVVAGLNMAFFHRNVYRSVNEWNHAAATPWAARAAGATSLLLWLAIITTGHMLPYEFY
jgi:uncharacterized protein DUF6644